MTEFETLEDKVEHAKAVIKEANEKYDTLAVGWTGGKDSTTTLHLVRQAIGNPDKVMFVDTGNHFEATYEFVETWQDRFDLDLVVARNDEVIQNQEEFEEELNDAYKSNQLLKTIPMHDEIVNHGMDALVNGVRWDETEARADEEFFSPREYPNFPEREHTRVHPILPFTEEDIWQYIWFTVVPDVTGVEVEEMPESRDDLPEGVEAGDLPISPKYWTGYRSLGSEHDTEKSEEGVPAWMQDFDSSPERVGREQDKENIMRRLRDWG